MGQQNNNQTRPLSYVRIWVYTVWGTKRRQPFLVDGKLQIIFNHIKKNAWDKKIHIDRINGYDNHMHVLMLMNNEYSIANQIQILKRESAHWAYKHQIFKDGYGLAIKYFVALVSGRKVPGVRAYIDRQQKHHQTVSFAGEFEHFLTRSGFKADDECFL